MGEFMKMRWLFFQFLAWVIVLLQSNQATANVDLKNHMIAGNWIGARHIVEGEVFNPDIQMFDNNSPYSGITGFLYAVQNNQFDLASLMLNRVPGLDVNARALITYPMNGPARYQPEFVGKTALWYVFNAINNPYARRLAEQIIGDCKNVDINAQPSKGSMQE